MKSSILMFLACVVLTTAASFDREMDDKWNNYKEKNHMHFSAEEESGRKNLFSETDNFINEQSKNKSRAFAMDHNDFSSMSPDEKEAFLGLDVDLDTYSASVWTPSVENRDLPASVDYRNDNCLQDVKRQGGCGSCWAFTAITPLEFSKCKKRGGKKVLLSEQQLVDCADNNGGCGGGWYLRAWKYLAIGSNAHTKYGPYMADEGACKFNKKFNRAVVFTYGKVPANVEAIKEAIQEGPLAVAMRVTQSFSQYKEGVYSSDDCEGKINHGVVLVGYGSMNGKDYWIIRNSWGAGWGASGYALIERGVDMCRIESFAAYVVAK